MHSQKVSQEKKPAVLCMNYKNTICDSNYLSFDPLQKTYVYDLFVPIFLFGQLVLDNLRSHMTESWKLNTKVILSSCYTMIFN